MGEASATSRRRRGKTTVRSTVTTATEKTFGHLRQWHAIQRMLDRGETPLRAAEFFYMVAGAGLLFGVVAAIAGSSAIVIVIAMVVGAFVPYIVVWQRMRRRLAAFETQLPDLLITIAASLKAGHSFKQGLQAVVDEGQPPASAEFKRVLTETGLGRSMDDALSDMSERVGSKNFEFTITAVTIQRQVGGSLANLFDLVADTVRQRQQFAPQDPLAHGDGPHVGLHADRAADLPHVRHLGAQRRLSPSALSHLGGAHAAHRSAS